MSPSTTLLAQHIDYFVRDAMRAPHGILLVAHDELDYECMQALRSADRVNHERAMLLHCAATYLAHILRLRYPRGDNG